MSQEKAQLIAPIGIMTVSGMTATGVITASSFTGNIVGSAKSLVNGTDVTAGVVTATSFVGNLTGNIQRLADSAPNINVGVTTATSFVGNLTGSVTDLTSQPAITVGLVTATSLSGPITGNVTGNVVGNVTGNVTGTIAGNVTGDVTGNATGTSGGLGINYNGGWTGAGTSQVRAGVVTATFFHGDGSNLDGVSSGPVSQQAVTIDGASTTIDLSSGNLIYATQSADTTVSFANSENGNVYFIRTKDDNTTERTITWPDRIKWEGGSAPTLLQGAGGGSVVAQTFLLVTSDMGVTWYGKEVVNYNTFPPYSLFAMGTNTVGQLAQNNLTKYSSPVQVPGSNWGQLDNGNYATGGEAALRSDRTLWAWGYNDVGALGQNNRTQYSSPVQVPGTYSAVSWSYRTLAAVKTDGTLWTVGKNGAGELAQNDGANAHKSSPVQVGTDTTWGKTRHSLYNTNSTFAAVKTDGTLWTWGSGTHGQLGLNQAEAQAPGRSSPTQIGTDTNWKAVSGGNNLFMVTKTNGELWVWGENQKGELGQNSPGPTSLSSPTQIPGTTWNVSEVGGSVNVVSAFKTDGTLWGWGDNVNGALGQNQAQAQLAGYSSPTQLSGTTWNQIATYDDGGRLATRSDGTAWAWGYNDNGGLGLNDTVKYSSPVQIPGTNWTGDITGKSTTFYALRS